MLDIDRLKMHNDRGGRVFGDAILRGVAEVIRRSVREADVVARYGGDEFLVVLPATHFAGSLSVAERIWRDVAGRPETLEAPFGVDQKADAASCADARRGRAGHGPDRRRRCTRRGSDVRAKDDALLKAADAALLHAKREGANRICVLPAARIHLYAEHGRARSRAREASARAWVPDPAEEATPEGPRDARFDLGTRGC